jgi:hypothetical protein
LAGESVVNSVDHFQLNHLAQLNSTLPAAMERRQLTVFLFFDTEISSAGTDKVDSTSFKYAKQFEKSNDIGSDSIESKQMRTEKQSFQLKKMHAPIDPIS